MTITQLEYFIAVANYGSFSAAAGRCFVTQPSLSMQVNNLEDELGVTLLDRSSKPITTTEVGAVVLEQAKDAVAAFYGTKEKVNDIKGEFSGKLRLGVIPTISPYLLPKLVPEFVKRCPKAELDIRDMFTPDIIDALSTDKIDVAILSGGYQIKIRETNLFEDRLYFYVSPKNDLFQRSSIDVNEVDVSQLLILSEGNCMRNQVLKILCQPLKYIKSQYNFANCSLDTLMHMVDATSALTVIPAMAIDYIPQEKHKQIKPFAKLYAHRKITMAVGHTYVRKALVSALKESVIAVGKNQALSDFLRT
ncbi:MAG: hydrogen peroxide-inducible genes activator [Bacteroidales bacterium]|nr:hydrogen peroxide-inducible genes activator [Bacteroidales bacterium]